MKNTLLITLEYPPMIGGVSRYYQHLMELLPRDHTWVLDDEQHALLAKTRWLWPRWIKGVYSTWRAITQHDIEHILVGQVLPLGTIAVLMRLFRGIPYTVMTHAMDITVPMNEHSSRQKKILLHIILRYAASVTTVSRYTKERLRMLGVPEQRIHIIHPCPHINGTQPLQNESTEKNTQELQVVQGKKVLLSVGRLVERKGFDMVIRAIRRIREMVPETHYVIVGEGPYKKTLRTIAAQLGVQDYISFIGQCSDTELNRWYQRCDLFIMPSRELENSDTEGFGIVFVEASSFGKPVIGSTAGGIADAVVDGYNGFIVDPHDIGMITDACVRLLTHAELSRQLGVNGQQRVNEIFQWSIQAKQLEQLVTTV